MAEKENVCDSDDPIIDDNIIRIQLRKPSQRKWELRTRNLSPRVRFPTIQLFDCEGNLLVETNDENISIKSYDNDGPALRTSQSLREVDYKHYVGKKSIRKHNTVSGGKIYTRVFKPPLALNSYVNSCNKSYIIRDSSSVVNIPSKLIINNFTNLKTNSVDTTPFQSDVLSEISSYKSSDDETCEDIKEEPKVNPTFVANLTNGVLSSLVSSSATSLEHQTSNKEYSDEENEVDSGLHKSQSFNDGALREINNFHNNALARSKSGACMYNPPHNKVSFLNTYLKSLPTRTGSNPDWFAAERQRKVDNPRNTRVTNREFPKCSPETEWKPCKRRDNTSDNEFINIPTDVAADCEMKKRLKIYRRGLSEIETRHLILSELTNRRHSVNGVTKLVHTSSSESVDEADLVLNRLKRRILKNKIREKRQSIGAKYLYSKYYPLRDYVRSKNMLIFFSIDKDRNNSSSSAENALI